MVCSMAGPREPRHHARALQPAAILSYASRPLWSLVVSSLPHPSPLPRIDVDAAVEGRSLDGLHRHGVCRHNGDIMCLKADGLCEGVQRWAGAVLFQTDLRPLVRAAAQMRCVCCARLSQRRSSSGAHRVEQRGGANKPDQVRLASLDSHVLVSAACSAGSSTN